MEKSNTNLSWVILAGGKSSRMGGTDKGLIELNNISLVKQIFNKLSTQTDSILINANRNQKQYSEITEVISDIRDGFQGPLAGIEVSLLQTDTQWVGFTPCDCPQISDRLVERLRATLDNETDICVATNNGKVEPVFSIWNRNVLPKLTRYLEQGDRKIMLFLDSCNTKYVDFSDQPENFVNLNSPEDLKEFQENYEQQ